jgi:hypothetical protein
VEQRFLRQEETALKYSPRLRILLPPALPAEAREEARMRARAWRYILAGLLAFWLGIAMLVHYLIG